MTGQEPLYTVGEVAEYLSTSLKTVRNMIARGDIGAVKMGKAYRIRQSDIDAYLAANALQVNA